MLNKFVAIFFSFTLSILFLSCKSNRFPSEVNTYSIKYYLQKASSNDTEANKLLGSIFDKPINKVQLEYINADSLLVNNKVYYFASAQFNKSEFNRFAIYNSSGDLLLLDKSLNGNISFIKDYVKKNIVGVKEDFITLDTINVSRISFYQIDDTTNVIFKYFNHIKWNDVELNHNITRFSDRYVKMEITSSDNSIMKDTVVEYNFNQRLKLYDNRTGEFDNFIRNLVAGLAPFSNDTVKREYLLNLSKNWIPVKNFNQIKYLQSPLQGDRYINDVVGAALFIANINSEDNIKDYVKYDLTKNVKGSYVVKFTDKILIDNYYVIYFEFSCENTKYLMLLEVTKNNYNANKEMFENIINVFYMDC